MARFELSTEPEAHAAPQPGGWEGLGSGVLLQNARWFTRIRWVVVGVLAAFGAVNLAVPGLMARAGLVPQRWWPWVLAVALVAVNVGHLAFLRRLTAHGPRRVVAGGLWVQIIVDLGILTVLVYQVGPLDTFIAFAYLFHIVLACIFFAPRESFLVALLSSLLFVTVVAAESLGVLPRQSIVAGTGLYPGTLVITLWSGSAVFIWFVIWYLVSTISNAVRRRDRQLAVANEGLTQADREKTLQVLRVTHDLKAPFSGIESNIQALRYQHWDETPESVRDIIRRIEVRSATLRERIRNILALGKLQGTGAREPVIETLDLRAVLDAVVKNLGERAAQRHVAIETRVPPMKVASNAQQMTVLLTNLLSNAIVYSHEGDAVEVSGDDGKTPRIRISDHGIGISEEALPHIFEEYYRSKEAAGFNRQSTGLGLAIVKQIAQNLKLSIVVESKQGEGTTFEVHFPEKRSVPHGQDQDHR